MGKFREPILAGRAAHDFEAAGFSESSCNESIRVTMTTSFLDVWDWKDQRDLFCAGVRRMLRAAGFRVGATGSTARRRDGSDSCAPVRSTHPGTGSIPLIPQILHIRRAVFLVAGIESPSSRIRNDLVVFESCSGRPASV